MKAFRSRRSIRGVSLIEILISMAIGLIVVAAVIVSFLGSGQATRYQSALSQMNQDAQIGLNLLSREVQLAGYVSPGQSLGVNVYPLFGCDGASGAAPFVDPGADALACAAAGAANSSAIQVVYEADTKTTVPTGAGLPSNCLGNGLALAGSIYIARNRYYVDTSTASNASGRPELYCSSPKISNAGTPAVVQNEPLLENVEDLQVWYGVVASLSPSQVIRYARAGKDGTTASTVNAQPAPEWDNVMSVKICLLMRSAEPVLTGEDTLAYLDCSSASQTSADSYLRRAYFTTATVRSKMVP